MQSLQLKPSPLPPLKSPSPPATSQGSSSASPAEILRSQLPSELWEVAEDLEARLRVLEPGKSALVAFRTYARPAGPNARFVQKLKKAPHRRQLPVSSMSPLKESSASCPPTPEKSRSQSSSHN